MGRGLPQAGAGCRPPDPGGANRVGQNTPDDWQWLTAALGDADRKWFVAGVFKFQPVAKRLFGPSDLLRRCVGAGPKWNEAFITPCVRSLCAAGVGVACS